MTDALLLPIRGVQRLYQAIGNIEILPDGLQEQLRNASAEFDRFADAIDSRVGRETIEQIGEAAKATINGVQTVAGAAVEVYEDIRVRAAEIAGEASEITEATDDIAPSVSAGADEVARLNKETKAASGSAEKLADLYKDIEDQQALIAAARLGEREERVAREFLNIRRQIKDITVEEARALAEQNVLLDEQLERIREQRAIIEAPFENLADNLEDAIVNGGEGGLDGLKNAFKSFFKDLQTSFLRQLLDPFLNQIRNAANGIPVSGSLAATPTGLQQLFQGIPGLGGIFGTGGVGGVGTPPINPNGGPIPGGQGGFGIPGS